MRPCARRLTSTRADRFATVARHDEVDLRSTLLLASTASASTWHVASNGSDSAAGSTAPFATIQHAADRVAAGDTVIVHAGTYTAFTVETSGTQAAPIAFVGGRRGEHRRRRDQRTATRSGRRRVRRRSRASPSPTRRAPASARSTATTSRSPTTRSTRTASGASSPAFCETSSIENNETSRSGEQHGIYASNSADRPMIRGNKIWGNAMCGIHMNGDISQGGDGVITRRARREQHHPRQRPRRRLGDQRRRRARTA